VSTLIGYTVLFVVSKVGGAGVRPDALLRQIGGSHVIALAPALSALLFVAASGSATNAWLGSMGLTRQTLALDALGVDPRAYLWAPAWLALGLGFAVVAALFALGMILGGLLVCRQYDVPHAWELLTADVLDPRPERVRDGAGPGIHRVSWRTEHRGGFVDEVGAAQLVGPFQDPARPPCGIRLVVGQAFLDREVAPLVQSGIADAMKDFDQPLVGKLRS